MYRLLLFILCMPLLFANQPTAAEAYVTQHDTQEVLQTLRHEYDAYRQKLRAEKERKLKEEKEKQRRLLIKELKKLRNKYLHDKQRKALEKKEKKLLNRALKKAKKRVKRVRAKVDISSQKMDVYQGGRHLYTWKVSTGKRGHGTPTGLFRPIRLSKYYHSKTYHNAPMPYSVFFAKGYALHGTKSISSLGKRASHGCVRLRPSHAKLFYKIVKNAGLGNTRIQIIN